MALALVGLVAFILTLASTTLFSPAKRARRYALAFGLLIGGPVWFFTFQQPATTLELHGIADAARAHVNLPNLQNWAIQVLESAPATPTNSTGVDKPLHVDWELAPADARQFLGASGTAEILQTRAGLRYVRLERSPRSFAVGKPDFRLEHVYPFWTEELAPGIYLQLYIRP